MAAALLVRDPRLSEVLRSRVSAVVAMVAMTGVVFLFPTVYALLPLALLGLSLAIVATGNTLFGLLTLSFARWLGKVAYSLYLLHGIVLYTLFFLVLGTDRAARLGTFQCVLVIAAVTPVVFGLAWASQRWIESPSMRAVPLVVDALRRLPVLRMRGRMGAMPGEDAASRLDA
jgi:peptidoglycan/LPS O-acetylase OafA/YrhL